MFEKMHRLRIFGLGLLATGVLACQQQQQAAKPIEFSSGGFEGLESAQLALLVNECDPTADPVVIKVADNEFAYIYLRPADSLVVANANASGGGECAFAATKKISIINDTAGTGTHNHKVLLDFLNGQFAAGAAGSSGVDAVGIAVDLGTGGGINQVMFRGTVNADLFTFGSKGGTSYGAYSSSSSRRPHGQFLRRFQLRGRHGYPGQHRTER